MVYLNFLNTGMFFNVLAPDLSRSEQSELVCRIRINNYGRIRVGYLILSENCHQYVKERHKPWIGKTCFLVNVLKCMLRFLEMFTRRF